MQTFKDSVNGQIYAFESDVVVTVAAGVYGFERPSTMGASGAIKGEALSVPTTLQPYVVPVPTAAEIAAAAQAATNADAKAKLVAVDAESVRAMREFILAKFPGDALLPAVLATRNNDAATQRARIK